jgi:hypothetical protein
MDNEAFQLIIYCLVNAFDTGKMRRLEQALARTRLGTAHYLVLGEAFKFLKPEWGALKKYRKTKEGTFIYTGCIKTNRNLGISLSPPHTRATC